jgi:hypothetical protein
MDHTYISVSLNNFWGFPQSNMKSVTCSRIETSLFKPFSGTDYFFRPYKALAVIPVSEPFNRINFSVHMKLLTSFRSLNSYNAIKAFHMTGHSLQYCWHKPHLQVGSISFQVLQSQVMSLHNNIAMNELARPPVVLSLLPESRIFIRSQQIYVHMMA